MHFQTTNLFAVKFMKKMKLECQSILMVSSANNLYPGYNPDCPAIRAPIEKGIQPVCDALNAISNVRTLWSCEGHPEIPLRPYVTFIAPQAVAFRVSQLINTGNDLIYAWHVYATFRQDATLQYTIEPNDDRISYKSRWGRFGRNWSSTTMENEL